MTTEQTIKRDWLNRAFLAEKKLHALEIQCELDRERAEHITVIYDKVVGGKSSYRENHYENKLIRMLNSKEKYNKYLQEYLDMRCEIEDAIHTIDNPIIESIMVYRHLGYMSIEHIAEAMNYSDRSIKRKYLEGLDKIDIHFG